MSTTIPRGLDESPDRSDSAGVARSEPVGRAQRRAGAARRSEAPELAEQVKGLLPDGLIDELLAGARTEEEIAAGLAGLEERGRAGFRRGPPGGSKHGRGSVPAQALAHSRRGPKGGTSVRRSQTIDACRASMRGRRA